MDDPKTLLDGTADDVKTRLAGLSHDDLLKVRDAELAGKKRADVTAVIEAALSNADASRSGGRVATAAVHQTTAADLDGSGPADIADATTFSTSGAAVQIVDDVDPSHPAVDANPRAGTSQLSNRIDFNDPAESGSDAVTRMLGGTKA